MDDAATKPSALTTLSIDIGGTGIKMLRVDGRGDPLTERARELTPDPATPEPVLAVIEGMLESQVGYDRVSVGFPGVVVHGHVRTAPNLDTKAWQGFELQPAIGRLTGQPTRVINDADLQGYGVIRGEGVELVLTLGTGLGSALFVDGRLVPNLELGHHPLRKDRTYEQTVRNSERKRIGNKKWRERVAYALATLDPIFNYDALYLGGGNAKHLRGGLPDNVRTFRSVEGLAGGVAMWKE